VTDSLQVRRDGSDPLRVVVLISGQGSNLLALLEASAGAGYPVAVVAVGSDRPGAAGLTRAREASIPTFVQRLADHPDRASWDRGLTDRVAVAAPDLVVSAGFLKLVGPAFLDRFAGRFLNTHNTLLPAFPGTHGPRDALAYGVKVAGATLFFVDGGVDTGPIVAQVVVPVLDGDTEESLTERIKIAERQQLVDAVGRMARQGWTISGRTVSIP
jgi:phosphoribosylglycinamide formyltransferase-1